MTCNGPRGCQTAVDGLVEADVAASEVRGRSEAGTNRLPGWPRCARNRCAWATRGGIGGLASACGDGVAVCPGAAVANTAISAATTSRQTLRVKDRVDGLGVLLIAEIVTRVQDRISASHP